MYANLKITSQNSVSTQIALCPVKANYNQKTREGETQTPRETKTCYMTRVAYTGVLLSNVQFICLAICVGVLDITDVTLVHIILP
jgi:hypothetical protein